MVGNTRQVSKLRFGSFEFDPRRHELRRNGFRIKLAASQLRLLTLFLERDGELVTREQIAARLWADTRNIDASTGINTAINRLRRHLQEAPGAPSAIETVIGLGYRFVPEVSVEQTPEETAAVEHSPGASGPTRAEVGPPPPNAAPPPSQEPEMKAAAEATRPALRGYSEQIVEAVPPADTEAAAVQTTPPPKFQGETVAPAAQLASQPEPIWAKQQSPAIPQRMSRRRGWTAGLVVGLLLLLVAIAAVPSLWRAYRSRVTSGASASASQAGDVRQIVQVTSERPVGDTTASAVSPDGKIVAYADHFGVSVHWFDSGVERLLGVRPAFVVDRLAWLPDESGLLMSGTDTATQVQQVWAVPLQGAYLQPILQNANRAVLSPDGRRMAFTRDQDQEIWEASSEGQGPIRVARADPGDVFGLLLWSPVGNHLVLTESNRPAIANGPTDTVRGTTYLCLDADSGKVLDREIGVPAQSGYMLNDGQLFFAQNNTPGPTTGQANLMVVKTDANSGHLIGPPKFVQKFSARHAQSLTASATGARFAAVLDKAETDTFVADLRWPGPSLSEPVRITSGGRQNFPHSWTADGRGVLLENDSVKTSGTETKFAIFDVPVSGSPPKLIAQLPGTAALEQLSPDGQWILFMQFEGRPQRASGVFRVPVEGGPVERVPTTGSLEEFHCSASVTGSCVLREAINQDKLVYYSLDPVKGMGEELARTPWEPNRLGDWGLSADGTYVATAQHDTLHPAIELISLKSHGANVQQLPVQGHGTTLGANWSKDGKTLFVECRTEAGFELLSLDLAGHVRLLRESPSLIWAVISRDGKKVAFPGLHQSSSVWSSDMQPMP